MKKSIIKPIKFEVKNDTETTDTVIKVSPTNNNVIFFYSEVNRDSTLKLKECIDQVALNNITFQHKLDLEYPLPIKINISSYGGDAHAALAAVDYIKTISKKMPVHTIVNGFTASAGTIISMVGTKRFIHSNAHMLIHQVSSWLSGTHEQIKDEWKNLQDLVKWVTELYLQHTKIPKTKLEDIFKHDLWFNPKQCKKYGLVDEIIQ